MEAYTDFAQVYDVFMDQTPYREWCDRLIATLDEYQVEKGLVLDLGCGTGTLTELLAKAGYDMIGVDHSEAMLNVAMEKRSRSGTDILYLLQDMREFELYGTVAAVVSVCDCINYLLEEEEVTETFRLVNNYLDPGGLFVFDFNTTYKYQEIIGDQTIAENREDCSFIWENYYHDKKQINEYDLTIFVKDQEGRFSRFQETHYQRGYTLEQIKCCLKAAGLEFVEAYDENGREPVRADSERIYCIAREKGKQRA
ncbi:MAG: class I SAM-dependent methyltransferase [Lachnospiraceae bacterium]|nr:class I SAM-dependent methyltransferase [Lachnospiraceae bacterium]